SRVLLLFVCSLFMQVLTRSTLFPYTTLFRSRASAAEETGVEGQLLGRAASIGRIMARHGLKELFSRSKGDEESTRSRARRFRSRSEEHTSELQSRVDIVCRLPLEKKTNKKTG